jgi:hypothetical protein
MSDMNQENADPSPNTTAELNTAEYSKMFEGLGLGDMTAGNTEDYSAIYNNLAEEMKKQMAQNQTMTV